MGVRGVVRGGDTTSENKKFHTWPSSTKMTRKRFSKKTKKDWRKHSDIRDVEEYLQGRSREEKFGLPADEKPDNELFFVHKESREDPNISSTRPTKGEIRKKPLQSECNLWSTSNTKGFPVKKRKPQKKVKGNIQEFEKSIDSSSDEEEYNESAAYRSIFQKIKDEVISRRKEHPQKSTLHVATRDVWSKEVVKHKVDDDYYLEITRKKKIKRPGTRRVPSLQESVPVPHPGMSYNPSFKDHQALLQEAVNVEAAKLKAAEKLERKLLHMTKMTHVERDRVWQEEMGEGLNQGKKDLSADEEEKGGPTLGKRPIRAEERKTRKSRRKQMVIKREDYIRKQLKARRIKMSEIHRLRSIKKEIAVKEAVVLKKQRQSAERVKKAAYLTKRLGRHRYIEPDLPVQLSSEMADSLLTLKPEGSIAMERFKSLQKRNIIEPRVPIRLHRKYKLLIKEKRSARLP